MKKLILLIVLILSSRISLAQGLTQTQPQPLLNTWIPGVTTTTIIDNRPAQTRQMTYISAACSGTGTWTAALSYSSSPNGSWVSYGASGIISNASSTPIAAGFKLVYPNYIRLLTTGTVNCNVSGFQRFYPGSLSGGGGGTGTVTDVTLTGTLGQITLTGTCSSASAVTCVFSLPAVLALPGTINKLTLTAPATGATLTLANNKVFTVNKTITLDGTVDGVTITFPASSATIATLGLTNTFTGRQDATGAASTAPAKTGTSLPPTCGVGDLYFKSDATAGQNIYQCASANVWTQQLNSGTLTSITLAGTSGQIAVNGTCTVTTTGTCTFSIPSSFVLPGTINGLTLTTSTGTLTIANSKTLTVSNSLTFAGTVDGVVITFPASSATIATLGLTNVFTGRQDASGAASTAPAKTGTSLPATCTVGDVYFKSDAAAGSNIYGCTTTNAWTVQGAGAGANTCGSGTADPTTGTAFTCYIRTDVSPKTLWFFMATNTPYFVQTIADLTLAGSVKLYEASSSGNNYRNLTVSNSLTGDLDIKFFEGTAPANNDCVKASVSGAVVTLEGAGAPCGTGSSGFSGSKALATSAISSATCSSAATATATGLTTADVILASFNGDPTGVTGFTPSTTGSLYIAAYPTADTINFKSCNSTTSTITPGAITLNWIAIRSAITVVASGTKALATSSITSATCTSAQTSSATGTLTTDIILVSFNGDPVAVTGYAPVTTGALSIIPYPTADTVNFKICNSTTSSVTPGAITLNWKVVR